MITWTTYLTVITVFLVGYYILTGLLFFRKEIFRKFQTSATRTAFIGSEPQGELLNNSAFDLENPSPALLDEIHSYMEQAAKEVDLGQVVMIASIRKILSKYPAISDPFIKLSINDLVIALAESKCGIEVRPEVLRQMWT